MHIMSWHIWSWYTCHVGGPHGDDAEDEVETEYDPNENDRLSERREDERIELTLELLPLPGGHRIVIAVAVWR